MERIKLKLKTEQLKIVNNAWSLITKNGLTTPEQKLLYDLTDKLAKKFKKKFIEKEFTDGYFSMKLEYNEAYFLNKALEIQLSEINPIEFPYEYNVIFRIANYITQKLQ